MGSVRKDDICHSHHDRSLEEWNFSNVGLDSKYYNLVMMIKNRFLGYINYQNAHPTTLHGHRGNEPMDWQIFNRYQSNRNIRRLSNALSKSPDKGVFLTLTIDPKIMTLQEAWENIAQNWHRFLARLRVETGYKRLYYIWVLEAQSNGYPHIHALFLGMDYLYWGGNREAWAMDDSHSKNLKHFWGIGSIYINRTKEGEGIENPVSYLMKYIRKTWNPKDKDEDDKALLTKSMLWYFNKRAWNTSRGLIDRLEILSTTGNERGDFAPIEPEPVELISMNRYEYLWGQSCPLIYLINKVSEPDRVLWIYKPSVKDFVLDFRLKLQNQSKIKKKTIQIKNLLTTKQLSNQKESNIYDSD
jgi:hypothetical protein